MWRTSANSIVGRYMRHLMTLNLNLNPLKFKRIKSSCLDSEKTHQIMSLP